MSDRTVWARSLAKARSPAPSAVDLEDAITSIQITDTMRGSSTVVLRLHDPEWLLVDSGFFDADRDGRIDAIDVNYPERSGQWWRCTQIGITSALGGGADVEMTFMERAAVHLMNRRGPLKVSRAKRTRAQFIKMLTDKVKAGGGIKFHSKQLNIRQPIASEDPRMVRDRERREREAREDKEAGINRGEKITFKNFDGNSYTLQPGELRNAERVLREAFKHTDDERPLLALLTACIVEAPFFRNPMGGDADSVGILQLRSRHVRSSATGPGTGVGGGGASDGGDRRRDIAWVTMRFLKHGFTGAGGAIALAKKHPDWSIGQIAQEVQGSAHPDRYDKVRDGAEQVLEAYGGNLTGAANEYTRQYNFEVGGPNNPRESFWDAANRLASEVKWAFFLDGQHAYYDPETSLIRQKPVAIITRNAPEVVRFTANWDMRQMATEATLDLLCEPFEFRAGEVFKLNGFGPASSGSTARLRGRWLIEEMRRDAFSLVTTFQLAQPTDPAPEPRSTRASRRDDDDEDDGKTSGRLATVGDSARDIVDALYRIGREAGGDDVVVVSAYRAGDPRDHGGNNKDRAARDIAKRGVNPIHGPPSEELDRAVVAIGKALGRDYGDGKKGPFQNADNVRYRGFRVQVIWRTPKWGGHLGHIHVGAKRIGGPYTPGESRGPQGLPGRDV